MTFNLLGAKARKGISPADPTQDAVLQVSLDTAKALAEMYCNRKFDYAAETATFHFPYTQTLQLNRYPLEQVVSVADSKGALLAAGNYQVILGVGQIKSAGWLSDTSMDVTYAGGYRVLPADLEFAMWSIFDQVYGASTASGGSPTGQVVNSITVPDVGTIRYETGGANVGGSGSAVGMIPATSISILNLYRLEVC